MLAQRLVKLRNSLNLTQEEIASRLNISRGTYAHYEIGKRNPDYETLQKIADFFDVTTDYLLGRSEKTTKSSSLSQKEERDISKDLEKILSNLESSEALAFDGEPLDDETKALMKVSLENSMRLAKQIAKNKFTPKKYK